MARIVVLGGSFGGLTGGLLELKRLLGKGADITVISDDDRFVFSAFSSLAHHGLEEARRHYA